MARKESLHKMQQLLLKRRDALRRALAGDLSLLKDLGSQTGGDVVDIALDTAQDEISSQLAEVESRELGMIEKALARLRGGEYGLCEACNRPIPMARLNALPYATMCIECQRDEERYGPEGRPAGDWGRVYDTDGGDREMTINDIEMDVP